MSGLRLYSYHRNSAGERVRIALNLKGIDFAYVSAPALGDRFRAINPQGLMPALEVDGRTIAQSSAILEYLEETYAAPPLLPADPVTRAQARAFGAHIAAEMHAITVMRVRRYLAEQMRADDAAVTAWTLHWLSLGLSALEQALAERPAAWPFAFGEAPGWADLHLVPQLAAARRLGCDLDPCPRLLAVEARCIDLPAFAGARPENQPDYPS
jgi:maleylacetoacetate isomerase